MAARWRLSAPTTNANGPCVARAAGAASAGYGTCGILPYWWYTGSLIDTERLPQHDPVNPSPDYAIIPFSKCRAITKRWISLVPSPISQILASRIKRSTG